jgi:hypothetical protein
MKDNVTSDSFLMVPGERRYKKKKRGWKGGLDHGEKEKKEKRKSKGLLFKSEKAEFSDGVSN